MGAVPRCRGVCRDREGLTLNKPNAWALRLNGWNIERGSGIRSVMTAASSQMYGSVPAYKTSSKPWGAQGTKYLPGYFGSVN